MGYESPFGCLIIIDTLEQAGFHRMERMTWSAYARCFGCKSSVTMGSRESPFSELSFPIVPLTFLTDEAAAASIFPPHIQIVLQRGGKHTLHSCYTEFLEKSAQHNLIVSGD